MNKSFPAVICLMLTIAGCAQPKTVPVTNSPAPPVPSSVDQAALEAASDLKAYDSLLMSTLSDISIAEKSVIPGDNTSASNLSPTSIHEKCTNASAALDQAMADYDQHYHPPQFTKIDTLLRDGVSEDKIAFLDMDMAASAGQSEFADSEASQGKIHWMNAWHDWDDTRKEMDFQFGKTEQDLAPAR